MRVSAPACAMATVLILAGCGSTARPTLNPGFVTYVETPKSVVGVILDAAGRSLTVVSEGAGRDNVNATFQYEDLSKPVVHFSGFFGGQEPVQETYLFGIAPHGAISLVTGPAAIASSIKAGIFIAVVAGLPSLRPQAIHWQFIGQDGGVVLEGDGDLG